LIRVAIADDHPVVCKGISAIVQAENGMQVVGEASNGEQLVRMFPDLLPDVTLIDLRMPGMGGVEAVRAIRRSFPQAGIIILTTYKGDEDIHRGLSAGAQGYLLKGMSNRELIEAIRNVHLGLRYLPQPVLDTLANRPANSELSTREMQVLKLIVKGMTNKQIAEDLGISQSTVKWHINIVLARLNVSDRTAAAVTAIRRGIVEL
jgi:DNA-binding NarL/FixJ family response regulator